MNEILAALNSRGREDVLRYFVESFDDFQRYEDYIGQKYRLIFQTNEFVKNIVLEGWEKRADWVTGVTLAEYHLFHCVIEKLKTYPNISNSLGELQLIFKVEYSPYGTTWAQRTASNDLIINLNLWSHANNWLQVGVRRPAALPEYFGASGFSDRIAGTLNFEHRPEYTTAKMAQLLVRHIRLKNFNKQFSNDYALSEYIGSLSRFNLDFFGAAEFELLHEIFHFLPSPIESEITLFLNRYRKHCADNHLTLLLENFNNCANEIRSDISAAYTLLDWYGPDKFIRLTKQITINFLSRHLESRLPYLLGLPKDLYDKIPGLANSAIIADKTHPPDLMRAKILAVCVRGIASFLDTLGHSRALNIDKSFLQLCADLEIAWNTNSDTLRAQYKQNGAIFNLSVIAILNDIRRQIETGDIYLDIIEI
ncbi:hypothetical protein L2D01_05365 [Hyphomonadaceae bacterium ML37]|nr:hypothetical protein L2D01_05365 [Hyphomonadaceae bacterium ML37]